MPRAVPIRTDLSAPELRRRVKSEADGRASRRMLAAVAGRGCGARGASRADAASLAGMDRQSAEIGFFASDVIQTFLDQLSGQVTLAAHALLIMDRVGRHCAGDLVMPDNITAVFLPPYSPDQTRSSASDAI